MNYLNRRESTGIFVYDDGIYREYKADVGNGSINSIAVALDYDLNEVHSYFLSEGTSEKIHHIVLEIFSRNVIFVLTHKHVTFITEKDIRKAMTGFSYDYEYSPSRVQDILTAGVDNSALGIDFLSDVLNIKNTATSGLFYAKKIKTYLQITDGILTDFQFDDGFSTGARQLRSANQTVFDGISEIAKRYRPDDIFMQTREINQQSEAWAMVPGARGNEYCFLHRYANDSVNFYMLMVCHYDQDITEDEFRSINFGRYEWDKSWKGIGRKYNCGRFTFQFSPDGALKDFAML